MALFLIGCLSFYLDIENFTDRAMVVLITMLVIATITSSIQAVIFVLTSNVFLSRFVCISKRLVIYCRIRTRNLQSNLAIEFCLVTLVVRSRKFSVELRSNLSSDSR